MKRLLILLLSITSILSSHASEITDMTLEELEAFGYQLEFKPNRQTKDNIINHIIEDSGREYSDYNLYGKTLDLINNAFSVCKVQIWPGAKRDIFKDGTIDFNKLSGFFMDSDQANISFYVKNRKLNKKHYLLTLSQLRSACSSAGTWRIKDAQIPSSYCGEVVDVNITNNDSEELVSFELRNTSRINLSTNEVMGQVMASYKNTIKGNDLSLNFEALIHALGKPDLQACFQDGKISIKSLY